MPYVLWLEWDQFYVPTDASSPWVVLREGRILDACPAARARGVEPGLDQGQLRTLLPEAKRHAWEREAYERQEHTWLDICADFTNVIEPIDQHIAALDLSDHPSPRAISERLIDELCRRMKLPLRYGAANSKWVAQLASRDPRGESAIASGEAFLAPLPTPLLLPVAPEDRERLVFLGYRTIGEVAQVPLEVLRRQFGEAGWTIFQAARGGVSQGVEPLYPRDSMRELLYFTSPIDDWAVLNHGLEALARKLCRRLEGRQGSQVGLTIRWEDGSETNRSRRFTKPIYHLASMLGALRLLLAEIEPSPLGCEALRISLADLKALRPRQTALIAATARPTADSAIDSLKNTFGDQSIRKAGDLEISRRDRVLREWRNATGWL